MKTRLFVIGFMLLAVGCGKTVYVPIQSKRTVIETIHDTTVEVRLEKESVKQVTTDTTSFLQTKYATSTASYDAAKGLLTHDLTTKDTVIPIKIKYVDKEIHDSIQVPYPVETIKEVNVLSGFQNFQIWSFWIIVGLAALYFVIKYVKKRFF